MIRISALFSLFSRPQGIEVPVPQDVGDWQEISTAALSCEKERDGRSYLAKRYAAILTAEGDYLIKVDRLRDYPQYGRAVWEPGLAGSERFSFPEAVDILAALEVAGTRLGPAPVTHFTAARESSDYIKTAYSMISSSVAFLQRYGLPLVNRPQ